MIKRTTDALEITRGTTNVFEDLGYHDAAERQAKLRLAHVLNQALKDGNVTHTAAARVLGLNRSNVSDLRHYKLAGFSADRLTALVSALDAEVQISPKPATLAADRPHHSVLGVVRVLGEPAVQSGSNRSGSSTVTPLNPWILALLRTA